VPYFSWLNAGALAGSAVVASALMVISLSAGPRRLINISFCLFAAAEAAWALASLLTDLQLWLGRGDPEFSLQNSMLFLTLMAPLLLLFTARSLGGRNRAADVAAVAGLVATAALGVPLYRGDVVSSLGLGPSGTVIVAVHPFGIAAAAGVAALLLWSLVLLLRAWRTEPQPFMILGVIALFFGLADGILPVPFPLLTVTNTASVALIGYAVTRRQVFNPLRETAATLAARVAELERAREAAYERARRLELLARMGRETTSILDPEELMRRAVRLVGDEFAFYNVSLFTIDGDEAVLRAASRDEFQGLVGNLRFGVGLTGITGWVAAHGTPLLVPDVERDPRYLSGDERARTGSELSVPVVLGGRVVGVLDAQSTGRDAFSEIDVFTLQTVADQLAVAMENARLYAAARRELAERVAVEDRLGILAEQSPSMIFINVGGRVVYANRRCEEIVGWRREELTDSGFDFQTLIAPESLPLVRDMFARHLRGEEVPPYEYGLVARDGRRLEVIITTRLVTFGGARGILGIVTDITGRKRTERLLHGLNAAALALEKAPEPRDLFPALGLALRAIGLTTLVTVVPPEGGPARQEYAEPGIVAVHGEEELCRLAASTRGSVFARGGTDAGNTIVSPLVREDAVRALLVLRGAELADEDRPVVTAFAHQVAAVWQKSLLLEELETSLAKMRRIQAQLVQSQKMEAIGRLAGGVAHDFNNLLTAIGGYADLMRMKLPEAAEERFWADQVAAAAARGAALTRKLLAFSRKQVVEPRLLDLREIVRGMEGILRRIIGEHIDLVADLPASLAPVRADPTHIEQVVMNLVVNASDAMPSGGRLTLAVADVRDPAGTDDRDLPPGEYVLISVTDTGVGMDAEVQNHLFEPFYTTKERGKGTGLGLSTVYGAVQMAGGHIRLTSEPGRGTSFRIYVPRAVEAAAATGPADPAGRLPGGTETVLVVEDESVVRDLVSRVLRGQGYAVLEAERGADALAICEQRPGAIDLVVTDIVMPGGMSGRDLAERIGTLPSAPRVLLISGYEDRSHDRAATGIPATPLLQKPFTAQALARRVRELLDGERA
jgi:PAS domain S-box-containing protein